MANKLTIAQKESIVKKALAHRFGKAEAALDETRLKFRDLVWDNILTPADKLAMKKVPQGWLPTTGQIAIQAGGTYHVVYLKEARQVPACKKTTHIFDAHHPVTDAFRALKDEEEEVSCDKQRAKNALQAALAQVNTLRQLLTAWPELQPFTTEIPSSSASLPALPTAQLNAMLDLPVTEKSK